jgi:hypothetical protein
MDFLFSGGDEEYDAGADDLEDLSKNPEAAMAFSKQLVAARDRKQTATKPLPFSKVDRTPTPTVVSKALNQESAKTSAAKSPIPTVDVLFDAEETFSETMSEVVDDDFGDFESAPVESSSVVAGENLESEFDLLGLDDFQSPPRSKAIAVTPKTKAKPGNIPSRQTYTRPVVTPTRDDDWDDFETTEPIPNMQIQQMTVELPPTKAGPPLNAFTPAASPSQPMLPPTNIPPPAILLSAFAPIIRLGQETLLDPLSKATVSQRHELLAHPATKVLLLKLLNVAIVLGRIIAGRKLRWKRDQFLAQGMRIGPASAGGRSGMKIAGVDKTELMKEDREVLDAVRSWKLQAGKLKAAVTAAASNGLSALPAVPEISEQIPVRTLKAIEGGLVAPHACALCGLKREERVAKVDVDVNDSFNEWWLDVTSMHVGCLQFWEDHKDKLKSR